MSKSAYVMARIEPDLKAEAEAIIKELGMTVTQVVTMLYKQVSRTHSIPIELRLTNKAKDND